MHSGQHLGTGYRRTPTDPHSGYNDMPAAPLFHFGHGLGYAAVDYSGPELGRSTIETDGSIDVSVTVTNTGVRACDEVVQFYAAHRAPGVTRPAQQLVAFARVHLEPGERRTVRAMVSGGQLSYLGVEGRLAFHAGPVEVQVGASSADIRGRIVQRVVGPTADWSHDRPLLPQVTITAG